MTNSIRIMVLCAAAAMLAAPASACETERCESKAQTATAKPLKLDNHRRKPVASSATRTVKKKSGDYVKVAAKHRPKLRPAPPPTAEPLSAAAAQAFASYELARVRVVTPEEISNVNLLMDAAATSPNAATVVGVNSVQVVSADEINDIDRLVDTMGAVSLDTLSRNLAATTEPKAENESWLSRMLMAFGGAFAAVGAMVRMLLG